MAASDSETDERAVADALARSLSKTLCVRPVEPTRLVGTQTGAESGDGVGAGLHPGGWVWRPVSCPYRAESPFFFREKLGVKTL